MLGMRIAALRRQAGMSQRELAAALAVSTSAIGMYEQGRREPSADRLVAMAKLFHVSTDYLLTGRPAEKQDLDMTLALFRAAKGAAASYTLRRADGREVPLSDDVVAALLSAALEGA